MTEPDDIELLRQFAVENSEAAFAALVARHVHLVYSIALRHTGDAHAAGEITQAVFIILARKAKNLSSRTILTGWLHQTTRLTAANYLRTEIRRRNREQEAFMQSTFNQTEAEAWTQIAPLLDDAISRLGEKERNAILLRYFENKSAREMADALRIDPATAQKRVTRAVEKLRAFFAKRGVMLTAAAIASAVAANSVQAAPAGLAKTITAVAIAKGAAASASTLILVKGALKIMAWTKEQMAIATTAVLILAAGTTTVAVKEIQRHEQEQKNENYQWQYESVSSEVLMDAPPLVEIVPSKFPNIDGWCSCPENGNLKLMGIGGEMIEVVDVAYGVVSRYRTVLSTKLPSGKFDFITSLPSGASEALRQKLKTEFKVVGKQMMIQTNVMLLTVKDPNSDGLKPSTSQTSFEGNNPGHFSCTNRSLSTLADMLQQQFRIPVIDQTGLTNGYDFKLNWDLYGKKVGNQYPNYPNLNDLKQALINQLGLELVPTNMPIEMLVVEKVKN